MSTNENEVKANALKEEGNYFLTNHLYGSAAEKYTAAIALHPSAVYYANRAQAYIKLEQYGSAISDANEAIKLDPNYIKAYYRRGSADYALGKLKDALKDFKTVVKIHPRDLDAQKNVKACEKAIREDAFNKAIESDNEPQPVVDFESMPVEASYTGPRLPEDVEGHDKTDPNDNLVDMSFVKAAIEHMKDQKRIHKKYVLKILARAREIFKATPTLMRIKIDQESSPPQTEHLFDTHTEDPNASVPSSSSKDNNDKTTAATTTNGDASKKGHITVCGDTHGQYYDLLHIFATAGFPSETNRFLFNGDYVDRGSFSFETVFTLILIKLACPTAVYMLRGNHETKNMNKMYGFEGEVLHKYDMNTMRLFSDVFANLPLAAVIQDAVFVVHGGLSTQNEGLVSLSEIEAITRNREPPESGLFSDLLWADPQPAYGRAYSKRGMGFSFGPDYTDRFLKHNNLQLVIRSHEVKDEGYQVDHEGKCITVFSAPNYCDQMGNKGAFIRLDLEKNFPQPHFTQFTCVPHPHIPPMSYAGNIFGL